MCPLTQTISVSFLLGRHILHSSFTSRTLTLKLEQIRSLEILVLSSLQWKIKEQKPLASVDLRNILHVIISRCLLGCCC